VTQDRSWVTLLAMAWRKLVACAPLVLLCTTLPGCVSGAIFTHVTVPLDVDLDATPAHEDRFTHGFDDSWKTLVIPLIGIGGRVQFDWGDMSIATAIEEADLETVHYADLETLSILGLWTQRWVHVYGE